LIVNYFAAARRVRASLADFDTRFFAGVEQLSTQQFSVRKSTSAFMLSKFAV
jgi:hypothetical protein